MEVAVVGDKQAIQTLAKINALLAGNHFVLASGRHSSEYFNKDAIYMHPLAASHLGLMLANHFIEDAIQVVAGPAVGGAILSQIVANHLSRETGREILAVYADKTKVSFSDKKQTGVPGQSTMMLKHHPEGVFKFTRGYDQAIRDMNTLVVEDVLTTGTSVKKVVAAVLECGGRVSGGGVLCNRGNVTSASLEVPKLVSLIDLHLEAWKEADCPLCEQEKPIVRHPGYGHEFEERYPDYPGGFVDI